MSERKTVRANDIYSSIEQLREELRQSSETKIDLKSIDSSLAHIKGLIQTETQSKESEGSLSPKSVTTPRGNPPPSSSPLTPTSTPKPKEDYGKHVAECPECYASLLKNTGPLVKCEGCGAIVPEKFENCPNCKGTEARDI